MSTTIFEYFGTLPEERIDQNMMELSHEIGHHFQDIAWLKKAFYTKVTMETNEEKYANSPMGTLGDRVLSLIIAEDLFDEGKTSKEITFEKAEKENSERWFKITNKMELFRYAFNDTYFFDEAPEHEKLPHGKHDRYFEALVAAIYKDLNCFEQAKVIVKGLLDKWEREGA